MKPDMTRTSLIRLLTRHQVNRIHDLYKEQSDGSLGKKRKTFKDYDLGYIHMNIKYLLMIPFDKQKRYLLVAIDRATVFSNREMSLK